MWSVKMQDSVLAIESTADCTVFAALADGFVAVLQVRPAVGATEFPNDPSFCSCYRTYPVTSRIVTPSWYASAQVPCRAWLWAPRSSCGVDVAAPSPSSPHSQCPLSSSIAASDVIVTFGWPQLHSQDLRARAQHCQ